MNIKRIALLIAIAPLMACIPGLRSAAADHAVITRVVVRDCKTKGVGVDKCTTEDLEAIARQAECLSAAMEGRSCGQVQ